jgi:hypothetical protein
VTRERLTFALAIFGFWAFFLVQAWNTPVLLDDWYQLPYWRTHDFGLQAIWDYGHYNYFHFNPRVGDIFLAVVNGPPVFHLVLTPLVELGLLWVTFGIAFARWPRATYRDLQMIVFIQVLLWITIPIPGIIYFYRPFTTNYLWAFGTTLALLVPYRFALARGASKHRPLLVVPMMLLGWLTGMGNEHTGPTAMVAMAAFLVVAYRKKLLRAWMLGGAVGLYVGYPMLFFAPGQALRYAGIATRYTPVFMIKERGLDGCFEIILDFLFEARYGIIMFAVLVLLFVRAHAKRGETVPALSRKTVATAALLILGAGMILVTLFASPTATERMFLASAILLVAAFAVFAERMFEERAVFRFATRASTILLLVHVVIMVRVYVIAKSENDARLAKLEAAPDNAVVEVAPYTYQRRTPWFWGDDFVYASLREYVGNEVFDLNGIRFDRHLRSAEPPAPDHYVAVRTYDPPLPPGMTVAPVRYTPTYWEWAIAQARRLLATQSMGNYQGHKLVKYEVMAEGTGLADPKHRPIYVVIWTPEKGFEFVDGRPNDDQLGRAYVRVWKDSVPKHYTEAYVISCGKTKKVEPVPDEEDDIGPMLPLKIDCKGVHTGFMCEPDRCWLVGRYWR